MANSINLDGQLINGSSFQLDADNRSFNYGDGFFESCLFENGNCRLWLLHRERMQQAISTLQYVLNWSFDALEKEMQSCLIENGLENENARVRIHIFRSTGGKYTPTNNAARFLISVESSSSFEINNQGLVMSFADKNYISNFNLGFKSASSINYVLAGLEKKEKGLDDLVLLNHDKCVAESISSNIYWFKSDVVYTPSLATGCVGGVARMHILKTLTQQGVKCIEGQFTADEILCADEVFLSNAVQGIRWVQEINGIYYKSQFAHFLQESAFGK